MQRFWATDGNRKCAVFVFIFSSHYYIDVVKSLFTSRYNQFENLRETTVLACEMFTSGCRPWLKNVAFACLSSLIKPLLWWGTVQFFFLLYHFILEEDERALFSNKQLAIKSCLCVCHFFSGSEYFFFHVMISEIARWAFKCDFLITINVMEQWAVQYAELDFVNIMNFKHYWVWIKCDDLCLFFPF